MVVRCEVAWGMVQNISVHVVQHILDSVDNKGMSVVEQRSETNC